MATYETKQMLHLLIYYILEKEIRAMRKKLNIHASAADLLNTVLEQEISIGANVGIANMKHEK